jgi:hypothetical protein
VPGVGVVHLTFAVKEELPETDYSGQRNRHKHDDKEKGHVCIQLHTY